MDPKVPIEKLVICMPVQRSDRVLRPRKSRPTTKLTPVGQLAKKEGRKRVRADGRGVSVRPGVCHGCEATSETCTAFPFTGDFSVITQFLLCPACMRLPFLGRVVAYEDRLKQKAEEEEEAK